MVKTTLKIGGSRGQTTSRIAKMWQWKTRGVIREEMNPNTAKVTIEGPRVKETSKRGQHKATKKDTNLKTCNGKNGVGGNC